jgi:DNA-binding NtrC family response regulator
LRVVLVGGGSGLEEIVRRMVGVAAELVAFGADRREASADLVVIESSLATARTLASVRAALPEAPVIVVSVSSPAANRLRVQMTPEDLAHFTYRQVVERFGRDVVADYLAALLRRHEGNVTKAALAAGLERESLHRLMRRFRLRGNQFRPPAPP